MICPNCKRERSTTLDPCFCGYNPRTQMVEKTKDIPVCKTCVYELHGRCRINIGEDGTDAWCDINNEDCPCENHKPKRSMEENKIKGF